MEIKRNKIHNSVKLETLHYGDVFWVETTPKSIFMLVYSNDINHDETSSPYPLLAVDVETGLVVHFSADTMVHKYRKATVELEE